MSTQTVPVDSLTELVYSLGAGQNWVKAFMEMNNPNRIFYRFQKRGLFIHLFPANMTTKGKGEEKDEVVFQDENWQPNFDLFPDDKFINSDSSEDVDSEEDASLAQMLKVLFVHNI